MRISRLFVAADLESDSSIELPEQSAHYVRTVLRLKKDQTITLFNGQGGEYLCKLDLVSKKQVIVAIQEYSERTVESALQINLGLGISRGDRMDWAVQKSVELGVTQITPLLTERCVIKFTAEKKQQRLQHWRNIAQHAGEQSGRTLIPAMPESTTLADWIAKQQGLRIFLDPKGKNSLQELQPEDNLLTLLSGPEGGFSSLERDMAESSGFIPVRLGQRIMRTETAALAAISAVQMLWGDFR
jgi:16S rRNA (uracil1498-N3)-methyltransferase